MQIKDAIETIEDYNEMLPQYLERIMNAAIEKCDNPSMCRDFINALCKREDELQNEKLVEVSDRLYRALKDYFAAGLTFAIFPIDNATGRVLFDADYLNELESVEVQLNNVDEIDEMFYLPYVPLTTTFEAKEE